MRIARTLVAFAIVSALAAPAFAEDRTIKGEIVDQGCYMKDKNNKGDGHKDCGLSCAKRGAPLAIVTSEGDVYQITGEYTANKNAKLVDHVAHMVEVSGEVTEKDGKKMINVTALKMSS